MNGFVTRRQLVVASCILALACLLTFPAAQTHASSPSFDCGKAQSSAEKLVCSDDQLAALDRETSRLFRLARDGKHMNPDRLKELRAYQRGWIKGRDECWKADELRRCVRDSYAIRIFELRQGYTDARQEDDKGISSGPMALECDGFDAGIGIAFISSEPPVAALVWKDRKVGLEQASSGSAARYEGQYFDGSYALLVKDSEAAFEMPGKQGLHCRIGPGG